MAQILTDYKPPPRKIDEKYPLEKWRAQVEAADKKWKKKPEKHSKPCLSLKRGKDYTITTASMKQYLWKWCRREGIKIKVSEKSQTEIVLFWKG